MIVFKLHAEHGIGEQLHHLPTHFEQFFLGQTNTSGLAKSSECARIAERP
jgi:hypothetical protein